MKTRRRTFLKQVPGAIGAGLLVPSLPALLEAQPQAPAAQTPAAGITADTLAIAQQVAAVSLPAAERELAKTLVSTNVANIQAIRAVTLAPDVEPAFSYRPPRPASSRPTARPAAPVAIAAKRTLPKNLEDLAFEPVTSLSERIRTRQITSAALTSMYLDRLKRYDPTLFCVVTLTEELAHEQADAADREIRGGRYRGPLHGIPYGIKDLFATKGIPTTWGAKPYANQVFDYDATAVVRLREAGAVLLGKLATGELAVGDLWFRGQTKNPWNPARGSSGSSAGPASATAAGLVGFAVGTETNGSIMSPASTCGVVGLRPTYGRVSRFGCMTLRWTLDKVGALARTVGDTALVLKALHGPDGHDETVADVPFAWSPGATLKGMKLGYVEREFGGTGPTASIYNAVLDVYRRAGATLLPISLPDSPASAIYAILGAEAGAMFDELVRSGSINELADLSTNGRANQLRASRFIPAVDYVRAQRARTLLLQQMNRLFDGVDVFLSPASSNAVVMANLTGHPGITVPAGFNANLPVGLMVTGPLFREDRVLQAAAAFESATDWHLKRPDLSI